MGLYAKSSFDLLCEQVNRDNPELEVPFSRDTVVLLRGPLTDNLGSSKRNTRAIFNGIQGSGVNGKREVFYDRVDLAKLYGPTKIKASAPASALTVKDMLSSLNELLGLELTERDLANPDLALGAGAVIGNFVLTISPKSVSYTGTLNISWTRAPVGYFPESGPGTKLMKFGSLEAGYFGVVPEALLFNKIAFYNAINDGETPDVGTIHAYTNEVYFKFAYKGRFIFVPGQPLIDNVNWMDIYGKGGVYPPYAAEHFLPVGTIPVDQKTRILSVKEGDTVWQLKPRLAANSKFDPNPEPTYSEPNPGGEWWDLFRHTTKTGAAGTGQWDDKTWLGQSVLNEWLIATWMDKTNPKSYLYTPKVNVAAQYDKTTANRSNLCWRPVLEIVNDLNLLQGVKFGGGVVTGRLPSIVLNIELPPATERLAGVNNISGTIDAPAAGPLVETFVESMYPLKDIAWDVESVKAIGQRLVVDLAPDRTQRLKNFMWSVGDLPPATNITITR